MTSPEARLAQFAGSWYPATLEEAESYWDPAAKRVPAKAVVCPHASWMYSGKISGEVYGAVQPADTFVVVGPNHTGRGKASTSLYGSGEWSFPEGSISIDEGFAQDLMHVSEYLAVDPEAHEREHCIELQVPFIRLLNPKAQIVPILMKENDAEIFHDLGRSLATVVKKRPTRTVMLVATTDMTHYESQDSATRQDRAAIERIVALDADGLQSIVTNLGISMCGVGPVAAVLLAARSLGASAAELLRYATSGDVTQDRDSVVGYAGIVIT